MPLKGDLRGYEAERAGFEPATDLSARTRFPVALLRPVGRAKPTRPPGSAPQAAPTDRSDTSPRRSAYRRPVKNGRAGEAHATSRVGAASGADGPLGHLSAPSQGNPTEVSQS